MLPMVALLADKNLHRVAVEKDEYCVLFCMSLWLLHLWANLWLTSGPQYKALLYWNMKQKFLRSLMDKNQSPEEKYVLQYVILDS